MNRLTRTAAEFDYCRDFCAAKCAYTEGQMREKCLDASLYERLRDYEDAEAEGRLLVLPCKVGTPIFWINFNQHDGSWIETGTFTLVDIYAFGKSVFLTREEAEAARKEVEA